MSLAQPVGRRPLIHHFVPAARAILARCRRDEVACPNAGGGIQGASDCTSTSSAQSLTETRMLHLAADWATSAAARQFCKFVSAGKNSVRFFVRFAIGYIEGARRHGPQGQVRCVRGLHVCGVVGPMAKGGAGMTPVRPHHAKARDARFGEAFRMHRDSVQPGVVPSFTSTARLAS